jgi:S1-C subfamily serine protease
MLYARGLVGVNDGNTTRYSENPTEAVKWYRRAAEQGDDSGQDNLGVAYLDGKGVPMDQVEAYKWLNLAAAQGGLAEIVAAGMRDDLAKEMTPDQIAEAQQLAREFQPRKESSSSNSVSSDNPTASGTGFFITDDGYLISNYHVVKAATKVRLVTSAGTVDAKVVQVDAANDLALLKADGTFSPLPIATSRTAHLGGTVATIGFPDPSLQGFSPKLAKGEIASLSGAGDDPRYFQISVPVQPGNSGGALVDERGNVIGIVSAKLDAAVALAASGALPENVNYAVKSSLLLSFLESVPEVDSKSKETKSLQTATPPFEDVVRSAQDAAVLVLVY